MRIRIFLPAARFGGDSHNADADVVKLGLLGDVLLYQLPGGIIDSFAVSKDMVHWEKSYIPLTERNNTYSSTYAHKPCVVKKEWGCLPLLQCSGARVV